MKLAFNRRQLFRLRPRDLPAISREIRARQEDGGAAPDEAPRYFRPPGALPDPEVFLDTCERCHACAEACPHEVIRSLPASAGRAESTPVLDPESAPCHWCPEMPCIRACPSGALALGRKNETAAPIGKAALAADACLNAQGILCDTCAVMCPPEAGAIRMAGRMPRLDPDRCVGCGLCVYHCESTPVALTIHPPELESEAP